MKRLTKFLNDKIPVMERTLICVYYQQAFRVAQDCYGIGEYENLLLFLDQPHNISFLKEGISKHVKYVSKQEANSMKTQFIPAIGLTSSLRPDAGVHALRAIAKAPIWKKTIPICLNLSAALKDDYQHTFVVDLDNSVLEIYFGRSFYPNSPTDRWDCIVNRYAAGQDLDFLTVPKLVVTRRPFMKGMGWLSGPLLMYGMSRYMPMTDEDDYGGSKEFGIIFTWLENVRKERALMELDFGLQNKSTGRSSTSSETIHEWTTPREKRIPSSNPNFDPNHVF